MEADERDEGRALRVEDLAALIGLLGIAAGTILLRTSDLGVDPGRAVTTLLAWVPVTLPAVVIVAVATGLELAAGASIARLIRGRPFERLDEIVLEGFVAAVIKDAVLLGVLGQVGLFTQPILGLANLLFIAAGTVRLRPLVVASVVPRLDSVMPFGVLLLIAWLPPILLMLASPVVPFIDILPNHVAPAEHLRTFGALGRLTETQSPIYGPSRIFVGYTALLGAITTLSGLPAGAALSAFVLPSTIVGALAVRRLAAALGGPDVARWALLTFAMTTSFARLSDARATVAVLPLLLWAFAELAGRLGGPGAGADAANERHNGVVPPAIGIGLALGGAVLVHPVIGFLGVLTVGFALLIRPGALAPVAIPALAVAAILAIPQAATMLGVALPAASLAMAVAAAIAAGVVLDRAAGLQRPIILLGRGAAIGLGVVAVVGAGPVVRAFVAGADPLVSVMEVALLAVAVAVALRTETARSPLVWTALLAGFVVATVTQLVPSGEAGGLLGDALRFELPKTLHYWVPVFVALLAASGLAAVSVHPALPMAARGAAVAAFMIAAALPIRFTPIDAFHLGEHRLSETFSIDLRWADSGFWAGFPNSRYVVDEPRQQLLDQVRERITSGEIGPTTPILHVADSFQQWRATPLGVFDGVTETIVAPDAVVSIHTVGGRLRTVDALDGLLASGAYPFVLLEPNGGGLPADVRDRIVASGYTPIYANGQGELFRLQR